MPEQRKSPFAPVTEDEKKLAEKKAKNLEKVRKEVEELAKKCLNDPKFLKYKGKYEKLERITIEYLKIYEEPDVVIYATTVKVAVAKLNQLGLLLHDIEVDNRPRKK